ncbi:hypothetical protein [Citrobacter amalonaticus]|uniref:hypothetical protein n=1 Tax=Citrobacter amalonaticus TaxID=35703 RepID=UPI0011AF97F0|nr:hypothetical protein [Citrobacter amalonaticus]
MTRSFFFSRILHAALFLGVIYIFSAYPGYDDIYYNLYYPVYAIPTIMLYSLSVKCAEWIAPGISNRASWNWGAGLICLLLAIPIGIIYLVASFISRKND